jgi:hypothetical protein
MAKCITGPICNGFSVMTVCNPTLCEYSVLQDVRHSGTYKYPRTVPLRGWINRAIAASSQNLVYVAFIQGRTQRVVHMGHGTP